jgi:uncharacterized protein VirK/YbjX
MGLDDTAQWPATLSWRRQALQAFGADWRLKARFLVQSCLQGDALAPLYGAPPNGSLQRYLAERPDLPGFLVWPYQCASWEAPFRIERIVQHFAVLDRLGRPFPLAVDDKLLLWDLGTLSPGMRIILDQPKWLFREGLLAISLFRGDFRAYSMAFSLYSDAQGPAICIGGVQGRSVEGATELYKELTKEFHGMRPRDLLLDALKVLAPALSAQRILAVADAYHCVQHAYFGGGGAWERADYDTIWLERGARRVSETHFEIPMEVSLRDLEEVPSRKRAQYRRRNEMLAALQQDLPQLAHAGLLRFDAT